MFSLRREDLGRPRRWLVLVLRTVTRLFRIPAHVGVRPRLSQTHAQIPQPTSGPDDHPRTRHARCEAANARLPAPSASPLANRSFHREQLNQRYAQPRPVQFYQGPLRRLAPQLTAAERLLQRPKLHLNPPTQPVQFACLLPPTTCASSRTLVNSDIAQRPTWNLPQPQDQGRPTLSGHLIGPAVDQAVVFTHITQLHAAASRWHRRGIKKLCPASWMAFHKS